MTTEVKTKKVKVCQLEEGDQIYINGYWRTFVLATPSLTKKGHINILVKEGRNPFHRVGGNERIERKVEEAAA